MTSPPTYTRDDVIKAIKAFYAEHGVVPSERAWNEHGMRPAVSVARRIFGQWTNAIDEADLPRKVPKAVQADSRGYLKIGGEERAKEGCLTTWENSEGKTLTLHRVGVNALREACAIAMSRDETYRLVAYSSPQSIYSDLIGIRTRTHTKSGQRLAHQSPEVHMMSRIGLLDLVHQRLRARRVDDRHAA